MWKWILPAAYLFAVGATGPAFAQAPAQNTYQNSCSNIIFVFVNNAPAMRATCRKNDNTYNTSTLPLAGITNNDGTLARGSGPSTFQATCGNIQILVDGPVTTLSAICLNKDKSAQPASLSLNGISNNNGNLQK
jgi:hypothetical protein